MKTAFTLLAMLAFAYVSPPAAAQPATVREQIEEIMRQQSASFAHKDLAGCLATYADDFQGQSVSGSIYDKQQAQHNIASVFALMQSGSIQAQIESITPTVSGIVVVSHEHTVLYILGRRTHKLHSLVFDARSQDVLVKANNTWRLHRERQLSQTTTQDGKVTSVKTFPARPALR